MNINGLQNIKSATYSKGLSSLKSGDTVILKIISRSGSSWQGSIQGKLLHFSSDLTLKPGQFLSVRVFWSGKDLILKHIPPDKQSFSNFISQNSIPDTGLSHNILEQFRTLHIPFSDQLFNTVFKKLDKAAEKRTIQLLLLMADKGLDVSAEDAEALQAFLYNPGKRNLNQRQQNMLKMFNSISGRNYHWIFTGFEHENKGIFGKIGIRYYIKTGTSDYIVFMFESGGRNWIFSLDDSDSSAFMKVFADKNNLSSFEKSEFGLLLKKLGKMGIKSDDIINNTDQFFLLSAEKRGKNINEFA